MLAYYVLEGFFQIVSWVLVLTCLLLGFVLEALVLKEFVEQLLQ